MEVRVLTEQDIEKIHNATLKILQKTGIFFRKCPQALEILGKAGCKIDNNRVYFPSDLVEDCLKLIPDRSSLGLYSPDGNMSIQLSKGKVNFATIGNAYYVNDFKTKTSRDATEDDLTTHWIVFKNLKNFPVHCTNLIFKSLRMGSSTIEEYTERCETPEQSIAYISWNHMRKQAPCKIPLTSVGSTKEQIRLGLLEQFVFRNSLEDIQAKPMDVIWVNPVSPLQYGAGTEGLIEGAKLGIPIMISSEVMMGATGPVTLAGSLAQHNAEVLAGVVLAQLVNPGSAVIYGNVGAPMDLRVPEVSHGNIETQMFQTATIQLADFYGLPSRVSNGCPSVNAPGPRAVFETFIGLFMAMNAGGNLITTGLLDSTVMISYEHWLLVDEIIEQLKRTLPGIVVDDEHLALDLIQREGHPNTNYISSDHTLANMRKEIYYSTYTGRIKESYEDWYYKAHKKLSDILQKNKPFEWDPVIKERMKTLKARLMEDNQSWRKDGDWWAKYTRGFN